MSFGSKIRQYAVISLDLSTARTDLAQGAVTVKGESLSTWKANTLTVLTLGNGTLALRLNHTSYDSVDLADNLKLEGIPFSEIYWTNAAQAGKTAKIFVAWVD